MVYVAMTITLLSSIIMCCVWFVKMKIHKSGYGTVDMDEDRVELTSAVAFSDELEKEEEEDPTGQPTAEGVSAGQPVAIFDDTKDASARAFTLEDGSSSEEEVDLGLGNNVAPV